MFFSQFFWTIVLLKIKSILYFWLIFHLFSISHDLLLVLSFLRTAYNCKIAMLTCIHSGRQKHSSDKNLPLDLIPAIQTFIFSTLEEEKHVTRSTNGCRLNGSTIPLVLVPETHTSIHELHVGFYAVAPLAYQCNDGTIICTGAIGLIDDTPHYSFTPNVLRVFANYWFESIKKIQKNIIFVQIIRKSIKYCSKMLFFA